jgi:hypothetical protein
MNTLIDASAASASIIDIGIDIALLVVSVSLLVKMFRAWRFNNAVSRAMGQREGMLLAEAAAYAARQKKQQQAVAQTDEHLFSSNTAANSSKTALVADAISIAGAQRRRARNSSAKAA